MPAFLAAALGAAQALGATAVEAGSPAGGSPVATVGGDHRRQATADSANREGGADLGAGLVVTRRLDGGRRERVRVEATVEQPAVVSVEGGAARLRRASFPGVVAAGTEPIEVVAAARPTRRSDVTVVRTGPHRPRARLRPAPADDDPHARILALTGAMTDRTPPVLVHLDPTAAAQRILDQLRQWGYAVPADSSRVMDLGRAAWPAVPDGGVLLVPLGSCEQHGPHLPLDTDTRIAEALARGAAAAAGAAGDARAVVAPALAYGSSGEHQAFPGTLSIGRAALEHVLVELGRSALGPFSALVFVNGHGGNAPAVTAAVATLRAEGRAARAWWPAVAGGDAHAGRTETALLLAIAPEVVGADRPLGNREPLPDLAAEARARRRAAARARRRAG